MSTTRKEQAATLPAEDTSNGKNLGDTKETVETRIMVAKERTGMRVVVEARWYMARRSDGASPIYCSVWIQANGRYFAGHGKAGGYGYCKRSAAFQDALDSAGIKLAYSIDGRGMSEVDRAMEALADALGCDTDPLLRCLA